MKVSRREDERKWTPRRIFEELDRYVIGQTKAKRTVSIAAYNHLKRLEMRDSGAELVPQKSNILMIGPTGCGKTHIARNLAKILELPFTIADATEYTEAGYYGKDVEVMIGELLYRCDLDVKRASRGIVFIDELDKIARRSHGARTGAGGRDIGGEGVQQSLLKLLEGAEIFVPLNVTQHWNKHDFALVDTTDILFICAGTFTDLHANYVGGDIGFGSEKQAKEPKPISTNELLEYGLLAELLGRLPVQVRLNELTEDELFRIVTEPPDGILGEYKRLLAFDGIELEVDESGIRAIVETAVKKRMGARGLRTIFEEIMHDTMYEAPEKPAGSKVLVNEKFVLKKTKEMFK